MVCQRELAPTTGQTHWQGYVRCATRKRMTTIKRLLNRENAHLEIAKGTEQQCKDYCTKIASRAVDDAEPFERGNFNPEEGSREGQGRRSDLEAAAAMIDSGASLLKWRRLTNLTLYVTTGTYAVQGAEGLGSAKAAKDVRVEIWWGPGGHGKTHWARQAGGGQSVYSVEAILHPGTATRGENDPAGRVQVGELADRHDEAPDGQVAVELPARYSNKYAAWRRVIILLNNSPATLYNAATGLTWRHSAAEYTGFSTLTTVWKA